MWSIYRAQPPVHITCFRAGEGAQKFLLHTTRGLLVYHTHTPGHLTYKKTSFSLLYFVYPLFDCFALNRFKVCILLPNYDVLFIIMVLNSWWDS